MKVHSDGFKQQIKLMGKEIDSKITIGSTVLGKNELNAVTPSYQGALLKSVMKELNIDSNVDIPLNSVLNYKFGVKVDGEYEYIDFGNYVVYKSEKQEDTRSYNITCYDKMLYSMVEYKSLQHGQFPMMIRDYIKNLCLDCNLTFKNENDEFANYDKILENDPYSGLEYTYRDVFDELAQVTASTICLDNNEQVEVRYITETNDVIDEEYLKNVNVNFGEKYGKINSIVLSRSGESDNVYLRDEQSVIDNGICELKIIDNQIMNFNNRSDYLPDILEKLNGLEYYLNDFTSTGVTYYDVCDRYTVKVGDKNYSCVMFNDEINITQGLEEIVYTEMPEQTETDYTKGDKTDRKINQTYIIVDKQNQEIQALASKVVPVSNIKKSVGSVKLENAHEGELHRLSIKGNISVITPIEGEYGYALVPSKNITPSTTLTPSRPVPNQNITVGINNILLIDDIEYYIDFDFLNYINDTDCDEFIYEDGKCWIIRRIGIDADGNLYATGQEVIEPKKDVLLNIKKDSTIKLKSFENVVYEVEYLFENEYTDYFSTKVEVSSEIKVATDEINLEVAKKIDSGEVISAINLSPEQIAINSKKLSLNGAFVIDKEGNPTINNGNVLVINNGITSSETEPYNVAVANMQDYEYNTSGVGTKIYSDFIAMLNNQNSSIINMDVRDNVPSIEVANMNSGVGSIIQSNGIWSPGYNPPSSESKKKNIDLDDGCLEQILETDICSFNWNFEDDTDQKHIGGIINDLGGNYKIAPKALTHDKDAVDLYSMVGMSWKAIQELYDIIKMQDMKNKELEEKLNGTIESN